MLDVDVFALITRVVRLLSIVAMVLSVASGCWAEEESPFDSFTSVCLINVDLSQQAGPYMIIARFLFMLTLSTCFSF